MKSTQATNIYPFFLPEWKEKCSSDPARLAWTRSRGRFPVLHFSNATRLFILIARHQDFPWNAIGDGTPTRRRVRRLRQIARGKFENVAHRLLPPHTFAKFRFLDASNAPLSNVSLTRVVDSNEIEIVTR